MSEIADLIEKMYGTSTNTPQTMSNITKSFTEEVTAFKGRELHDSYAAIYMDATYIPLKRKTVAGEGSYSYRSWHSPGRIKGSIELCDCTD